MDLHRLEVFCKLMAFRSFSRTAVEMGLTQPTVSGHIKTLEEELELRLFDRYGRQVMPTSAAHVLLDYAQRMLELRQEAHYALEQFKGLMKGRLRLGGSTIPGGYILPVVIGRFGGVYPEARVTLILGDTHAIVNRILEGDIEIGMVGAVVSSDDLEFTPVVEDEMLLAVPPDHPWAGRDKPLPVRELAKTPFIMREEGSGTRAAMVSALAESGVSPSELNVVAEMGSTEAVLHGVKAGLGVSILSRFALDGPCNFNLVKIVPVAGLNLRRQFYAVSHKKRTHSPLCLTFLEFLKSEVRTVANGLKEKK